MKVSELIEKLTKLYQDKEILIHNAYHQDSDPLFNDCIWTEDDRYVIH